MPPWLRVAPQPARWSVIGATGAGVIGGIAGLIIGLHTYAPTAPFAVVELGLPAGIVGGATGAAAGGLMAAGRRVKRPRVKRPRVKRPRVKRPRVKRPRVKRQRRRLP